MDWREHYNRNTISAEEAVKMVNSGDTVAIGLPTPGPDLLIEALAGRKEELNGVRILCQVPSFDPGWLQPGWDNSFQVIVVSYLGGVSRPAYYQHLIDYYPMGFSHQFKVYDEARDPGQKIDVLLTVVSVPDEHGFCSFGYGVWDRRRMAHTARVVIAQVDASLIRTYGTNYIHVSDIDRFVEHTTPGLSIKESKRLIKQVQDPKIRALLDKVASFVSPAERQQTLPNLCGASLEEVQELARRRGLDEPSKEVKSIAGYVSEIIRNGDTLQIGIGSPSGYLPRLGVFDNKMDLGWHSEMAAYGVVDLIKAKVITGSRKTINRGIAVFTGLNGSSADEMEYAAENPLIELHDSDYVVDIRMVASHDNYVAINNAVSIDLSGQITSETIRGRLWNGTGGQPELHMGAVLSKGGRAITLLRSTAANGTVSRIVAQHEEGTAITIPRTFADIIITEYGVARLLGKSIRERARDLIAIAHPDFRRELTKAAEKLYYP